MKGILNKKLIIIASTVLVIVGALVAFLTVIGSPKNVTLRSVNNFIEGITKRDEVKPIYNTLKRGSVDFSLENLNEIDSDGYSYDVLGGDYYGGKLYFGKNKIMLDEFNSSFSGVELRGQLYMSDKEMYVSEENILDGSYGIKYSDLLKELKKSIFAPDSESDYALDEETYDNLVSVLENIEDINDLSADVNKTAEKVIKDILNIFIDNAEFSSKKASVRINREKTNVRQITIEVDGDAMSSIIMETYDYLRDSKDINKLLSDYDDLINSIMETTGSSDEYDSVAEAYKELFENYEDYVEDLCESIEEEFESLEITFSTPKRQAKILKLEIEYGDVEILTLDCGKNGIKKSDVISIEFLDTAISYKISEDSNKLFKAKFELTTDYGDEYSISIEIDKKADTYKVVYNNDNGYYGDKYTIKGSISDGFNKTMITIDKITYSEVDLYYDYEIKTEYKVDCNVIIKPRDTMPGRDKNYYKISDITDEDIEAWMESIGDL